MLDEISINSNKRIPKRKEITEKYGLPDYAISGQEIQEKVQKYSYGLNNVLMMNFADKIVIRREQDGNLQASTVGNYKDGITFVLVDGIVVLDVDYFLIQQIPPEEVIQFDVIEHLKSKEFLRLFQKTFPTVQEPPMPPFFGSIISIYTKTGKGIHASLQSFQNLKMIKIPVFDVSRKFYSPKYDYKLSESEKLVPDLRTLLQWNPSLLFDENGEVVIPFYSSDINGNFKAIVEVISNFGRIGYQEISFQIED